MKEMKKVVDDLGPGGELAADLVQAKSIKAFSYDMLRSCYMIPKVYCFLEFSNDEYWKNNEYQVIKKIEYKKYQAKI